MDKTIQTSAAKTPSENVLLRQPKETKARSIAKVVTYRIAGSTLTAIIVDATLNLNAHLNNTHLSHKQNAAYTSLGFAVDMVSKLALQYGSERVWTHINWGWTNGTNKSSLDMRGMLRRGIENIQKGKEKVMNFLRSDNNQ